MASMFGTQFAILPHHVEAIESRVVVEIRAFQRCSNGCRGMLRAHRWHRVPDFESVRFTTEMAADVFQNINGLKTYIVQRHVNISVPTISRRKWVAGMRIERRHAEDTDREHFDDNADISAHVSEENSDEGSDNTSAPTESPSVNSSKRRRISPLIALKRQSLAPAMIFNVEW